MLFAGSWLIFYFLIHDFLNILSRYITQELTCFLFLVGHSFLNIGSGTGYFNVLVGYMIGRVGVNRGIEISSPLVDFAREKTDTFLKNTSVGVCSPMFIAGNCFRLDTTDRKYDRVYCGAECSELQLRDFILKTIKIGGVAVVPCNKRVR